MASKFLLTTLSVAFILTGSNVLGQCNTRPSPCRLTCHCNTTSCLPQHAMGCGNLGCQLGWSGPTCQKQNTAYKARTVESSSELSLSNTDNLAFDGNLNSVFRSAVEANPYVTVRTATSGVQSVKIYNGEANLNDLSGFEIYVSESADFINSKLCYRDNTNIGQPVYAINCTEPLSGQYVKLTVPKTTSLTIRELEIYNCGNYWFGSECDRLCNCGYAWRTCNGMTGACQDGCADGFNGTDCYTECPAGTWGTGCQKICHCKNVSSCNNIDGTCDGQGCAAGFRGDNCQNKCNLWEFGEGCQSKCQCSLFFDCNKETGRCPAGCAGGYQGDNCQEECEGSYGNNCQKPCHCKNQTSCDKVNGYCDRLGCEAGYTGTSCESECSGGRFGENCQYYCHCINSASCNRVNGTCDEHGCANGYKGDNCQEDCDTGTYGKKCGKVCHCKIPVLCNKVNGNCGSMGCEAGYQGYYCDSKCSAGRFGEKCQNNCHCRNNTSCNHVRGTCDENGCAVGFKGDNCQETTASGSTARSYTAGQNITETTNNSGVYNQEGSNGLLAGVGVMAGICFVVIVYAIIATLKGHGWYKRLQQEVKSRYASVELSKGGRNSEIYEKVN